MWTVKNCKNGPNIAKHAWSKVIDRAIFAIEKHWTQMNRVWKLKRITTNFFLGKNKLLGLKMTQLYVLLFLLVVLPGELAGK